MRAPRIKPAHPEPGGLPEPPRNTPRQDAEFCRDRIDDGWTTTEALSALACQEPEHLRQVRELLWLMRPGAH